MTVRHLGWGLALLGLVGVGLAQRQTGAGQGKGRIDHLITYLTDTLKLTAEQQEKVRAILQNHAARAQEIRRQERNGQVKREALRKLRAETDAAIVEVLTAEQRPIWESIKADWRRRARARWEKRTGQRLLEEDE